MVMIMVVVMVMVMMAKRFCAYFYFQRIKEDVTSHEEALARIVTIVGKLTDDENVSENEKNNIKAEMNRLQEKWNTTQNTVNINYLRCDLRIVGWWLIFVYYDT